MLVKILDQGQARRQATQRRSVLLVRPPFFAPLAPPLGLGLLKSFLQQQGHSVRCVDLNVDSTLWDIHHRYFQLLAPDEGRQINDGYSHLWCIITAHMNAFVTRRRPADCARVLGSIAPLYGIAVDERKIAQLHDLIECFFSRLSALVDQLDVSAVDFVGTSTYTTSLPASLYVLREMKTRRPGVRTVMGGGVFFDDLAVGSSNLEVLLREYGFVDHVVIGEGELLMSMLVDGELAAKRLITIADLGSSTLAVSDVPTPDFDDFDRESYLHLTVEGGRSCPFQCSFCSETVQWGEYRKKPKEVLANQMQSLAARYGNSTFFMGDSLMNPYVQGLAGELLSRGAELLYDGYLRADKPMANAERVAEFARSGLFRARLGIETASPSVLKSMSKMTTPDTISAVLRTLAEAGIRTTTYWIVGYQGETDQQFHETLAFIREHARFIYELEAHPYYYFPYGQVASRLFESEPIHPGDVSDVLKFDTWEIVGACPPRRERYARLQQLSDLASSLELPNIYSVSDRNRAEERWLRLWPAAREVY